MLPLSKTTNNFVQIHLDEYTSDIQTTITCYTYVHWTFHYQFRRFIHTICLILIQLIFIGFIYFLYSLIYLKMIPDDKLHFVYPAGNYMFKVNNRSTRTRCEICSKLIIKTPERRHWRRSSVFIVNFEHISHLVLVFLLLTLSR